MNENNASETTQTTGFGWTCADLLTPVDARNLRAFNVWLLGWALSFAVSTILIKLDILPEIVGYCLVALTLVLGVGAIKRYISFLREADELLKKIQLEALAIGFGGVAVFALAWRLLEQLGAPVIPGAGLVSIMLVSWAVGQRIGIRRYTGIE